MRKGQVLLSMFLAVLVFTFIANTINIISFVSANSTDPLPPQTLNPLSSERLNVSQYSAISTPAEAGNLTELDIRGTSVTKVWQGFYGNISGTLVLQNSENETFYDWQMAEPKGEVYASVNNSIGWNGIACFNYSATGGEYNVTTIENQYGVAITDEDGLNETFNTTTHPAFQVGTTPIALNSCPATNTYVNSAWQTTRFHQILLNDNTGHAMVYATIIEEDAVGVDADVIGFDGEEHDFQLLVMEDGHDGQEDSTTPIYFWVELQ